MLYCFREWLNYLGSGCVISSLPPSNPDLVVGVGDKAWREQGVNYSYLCLSSPCLACESPKCLAIVCHVLCSLAHQCFPPSTTAMECILNQKILWLYLGPGHIRETDCNLVGTFSVWCSDFLSVSSEEHKIEPRTGYGLCLH